MSPLSRVLRSPGNGGVVHLAALMVGAAFALAACGSQTSPSGADATPKSSTTSSPSSSGPDQPDAFPLTLSRTGGVAGFHDVLVVAADGLASVTGKAKMERQCQLTDEALERLTTAVSQVPWPRITPTSTAAAFPDDLVTLVRSPAGGPVRLDDPQVGAGGPDFEAVLADVAGDPSASKLCKQL